MLDTRTSTVTCKLRDWLRLGGRFSGLNIAVAGFLVLVTGVLLRFLGDFIDDHVHTQGAQAGTYILFYGDSGEAEHSFRREGERHSGMIPNTIGA